MSKVTVGIKAGAAGQAASGAVSKAAGGLSREQLVKASLELLHDAGLDALTTRRLAARLGVKSPALYWHVSSKSELLALVADTLCAQMTLPSPRLSPRRRLEQIAWEYRRVLLMYRTAPRLMSEQPPTGPHRMKLYDAAVGALRDAGFQRAKAVAMATFFRNFLLGMISEEARQNLDADTRGLLPANALAAELRQMSPSLRDYPNLRGMSKALASIKPEALFRTGLDVILDGIEGHGTSDGK